nr:uncharacterized protein LOC123745525 isoform X1 [Procambarus clarkii]
MSSDPREYSREYSGGGFSGWDDFGPRDPRNDAFERGPHQDERFNFSGRLGPSRWDNPGSGNQNIVLTGKGKRREGPPSAMKREAPGGDGDSKRLKPGDRWVHNQDEDVYGPRELSNWNDIVDHTEDISWYVEETKRLVEQFGNFVAVKPVKDHPERVEYYCELCFAIMNAKKSLEIHCSGMKHLKKKQMWEQTSKDISDITKFTAVGREPAAAPPAQHAAPPAQHAAPPAQHAAPPAQHATPPAQHAAPPAQRAAPPAQRAAPPAQRAAPPAQRAAPPAQRAAPPAQRAAPPAPPAAPAQHSPSPPPPYRGDAGDRGYSRPAYDRDRGHYNDDLYDRRSSDRGGRGRHEFSRSPSDDRRGEVSRHSRRSPLPPALPVLPEALPVPRENLAGGTTGTLLKRLADCSVKTDADAKLAMDVISLLFKSLKAFHNINGYQNAVLLVSEAEVKFNILRELHTPIPQAVNTNSRTGGRDLAGGIGGREPSIGSGRREPSMGSDRREPSMGSDRREPSMGSGRREPSVGSDRREPSTGSGRREPSIGNDRREPSIGNGQRETSVGSGRREPPVGSGRREPPIGKYSNPEPKNYLNYPLSTKFEYSAPPFRYNP